MERLSGSAMLATPTPRLVLCRGPPASGKSTAFRTLATDPPAGVVFVDHVALKDAHRHLGGAARTEWGKRLLAALLSAYISNTDLAAPRVLVVEEMSLGTLAPLLPPHDRELLAAWDVVEARFHASAELCAARWRDRMLAAGKPPRSDEEMAAKRAQYGWDDADGDGGGKFGARVVRVETDDLSREAVLARLRSIVLEGG